jgi:hypothetical protein
LASLFGIIFVALVTVEALLVVVTFIGLDPGLPWESKGLESVGYLFSRILGVRLNPQTTLELRHHYDEGLTYRRFKPLWEGTPTTAAITERARGVDSAEVAWRILSIAIQLDLYRRWRRWVVSASLGLVALVVVPGSVISISGRLGMPRLATTVVVAGWVALVVGLLVTARVVGNIHRRLEAANATAATSGRA